MACANVLVVDDEEMVCDVTLALLSLLGHRGAAATSSAAALQAYATAMNGDRPFDLVLTDLILHNDIGGKEVVSRLRAIDPHVKVIAVSGAATDPIMDDCRAHGFHGVLAKPYMLDELREQVLRVLNN